MTAVACLAGHSHHVGFGGAGSTHNHKFLLAADVTVHHGGYLAERGWWVAVSSGAAGISVGDGKGLVEHADGSVLSDSVGYLERVDPQRELAGKEQIELLDAQTDALTGLSNQRVHLVIDAYAAITRTFVGTVWEPVVLVLLCKDIL